MYHGSVSSTVVTTLIEDTELLSLVCIVIVTITLMDVLHQNAVPFAPQKQRPVRGTVVPPIEYRYVAA